MDYAGALVGLGNPGNRYAGTRHNCGFAFVDFVLEKAQVDGHAEALNGAKFQCDLWRFRMPGLAGQWLAAKPLTMMNASGRSAQPLLAWHRLDPRRLIVAHDELDIPAGELRYKVGGGNAGHNGLASICGQLGNGDFGRLRIGIGRPPHKGDVINWVLGRPDAEDASRIAAAMPDALEVFLAAAAGDTAKAARLARAAGRDAA
ncbi:aminoacyl-tRNA hydrolase [Desulfovibrio sp.]|uniref:aminoacyl-tRNA hydrolase n=1 Tax=Desulfovibrio sp. TaxID=885 RepID=UPI0023C12172|nr:aminoacyl-tRNA hydrolase [Desulfovibrio sp.]MDE7240589.1 aminoacyl-tRNA hydrolase [Desulfovibrio sp.]